jgi:hypothetical protein
MPLPLATLLVILRSIIRSRRDLQLENLALRLQINVLHRGKETREVDGGGSPLLGLSVTPLERLAFHVGHR